MATTQILKLRKQWFKLKAREFIRRYMAGLLVLVIFLPGVAIGDNFKVLMIAATKPLLIVVLGQESWMAQLLWLLFLSAVFIVWARAQRQAISGGAFAEYMQSLPMSEHLKYKNNIIMLLISNHFLWFFTAEGFYFLYQSSQAIIIDSMRYVFLILLFIGMQYAAVFYPKKYYYLILGLFSIIYILPVSNTIQWILAIGLFLALVIFWNRTNTLNEVKFQSQYLGIKSQYKLHLTDNLYLQILFKSGLSSSLFRFAFIAAIMIGFSVSTDHFASLNDNDLRPYAYVLEAIVAYYLSGFYVNFTDERKQMHALFNSLPLKKPFWIMRDLIALMIITLVTHVFYFMWAQHHFNARTLLGLYSFNMLLLWICYPLRIFVKNSQTFISFVVLFMITAITLFNVL